MLISINIHSKTMSVNKFWVWNKRKGMYKLEVKVKVKVKIIARGNLILSNSQTISQEEEDMVWSGFIWWVEDAACLYKGRGK